MHAGLKGSLQFKFEDNPQFCGAYPGAVSSLFQSGEHLQNRPQGRGDSGHQSGQSRAIPHGMHDARLQHVAMIDGRPLHSSAERRAPNQP